MIRTALLVGAAALLLGATSCSKDSATTTAATTAAPAASSTTATTAKDDKATTTTEKDDASTTTAKGKTTTTEGDDETTTTKKKSSKTPVTKPTKIEKIDQSKLPSAAKTAPQGFDLTGDEQDCVNTIIYTYTSDETNPTDDASMSGVLGQSIALCVDTAKVADGIVTGIEKSAPQITATQSACIKDKILATDLDELGVFLGTFMYEGAGADELQQPYIEQLAKDCL